MATVIDETTGAVVEVVPVMATAAVASVSNLSDNLPPDAASRIEQAMVAAITNANSAGITDPDEIKQLMLSARESVKLALRQEMQG